MRYRWSVLLMLLAGCVPTQRLPDETQQVAATPFAPPRPPVLTRVNYAPASQETAYRLLLIKDKLVGENPTVALKPYITAIASADPEIFHVGMNQIYITDALVRQCQTEGQLAAVLAFELGKMIAEREAGVSDDVRNPERQLPIHLPIGANGYAREADPINFIELARHEKQHPRQTKKLARPNPHLIARDALERAGYQRTDLDAALPILQHAERFRVLEHQFKGTAPQGNWQTP